MDRATISTTISTEPGEVAVVQVTVGGNIYLFGATALSVVVLPLVQPGVANAGFRDPDRLIGGVTAMSFSLAEPPPGTMIGEVEADRCMQWLPVAEPEPTFRHHWVPLHRSAYQLVSRTIEGSNHIEVAASTFGRHLGFRLLYGNGQVNVVVAESRADVPIFHVVNKVMDGPLYKEWSAMVLVREPVDDPTDGLVGPHEDADA